MDERLKQITNQILASGKITQEELTQKIEEKLKSLGGLISEEGAVHIIANDLGLSLGSAPAQSVKLKDVLAGMRNVTVLAKVLRKYEARTFGEDNKGKVGNLFIGDDSGFMRLTFWNDKTEYHEKIQEGDVIEVQSAYSKENNGRVELHMGNTSHVIINPEGKTVDVKERTMQTEAPRKKIGDIADDDTFVYVLGTIVQAFDPRYFERTINGQPTTNYVMNILLDDNTGNIRSTIWKEQLQSLLDKKDEEILAIREDTEAWEQIKTDLLGQIIEARARVKTNEQYNTKELVLYNIKRDPQPPTSEDDDSYQTSNTVKQDEPQKKDFSKEATTDSSSSSSEESPAKKTASTTEDVPSVEEVTEEMVDDTDEELLSIDDIDKALD